MDYLILDSKTWDFQIQIKIFEQLAWGLQGSSMT